MAETAPEAVAEDKDSINGVQQLSQEATIINQSFSQQACAKRLLLAIMGSSPSTVLVLSVSYHTSSSYGPDHCKYPLPSPL